jgi:hypothetical protein
MNPPIYRHLGEKLVAFATRQRDGTLKHDTARVAAVRAIPNIGLTAADRKVSEVLMDEALLKERSLYLRVPVEAVVVLESRDS